MKIELELKVEMKEENIEGTGKMGYLPEPATYEEVCKVFGKPGYLDEQSDEKVKVEWTGRINGLIFTIYDYKSEVSVEKNRDWHIGGHKKITADLVRAYFENQIRVIKN